MAVGVKSEAAGELFDRALEFGIIEGHEAPAGVAEQVMVVVSAGFDPFVSGGRVAEF